MSKKKKTGVPEWAGVWHKMKYNRVTLFFSIVWRRWDSGCDVIDVKTAWEVANGKAKNERH